MMDKCAGSKLKYKQLFIYLCFHYPFLNENYTSFFYYIQRVFFFMKNNDKNKKINKNYQQFHSKLYSQVFELTPF